jgi:hypothetical protein
MDNLISRSQEYLYAESFEEWLMEKYEIDEEEFESFSYDRQDMLKNEYLSDKDFASFTSGNWTEEQDEAPTENTDLFEPEDGGDCSIVAVVSVVLAVITLLIWFKPFTTALNIWSEEHKKENAYETEQDAKDINKGAELKAEESEDGYMTITDTVLYKNLTPGKEYTITGTITNMKTGKPYTDRNGNPIEVTKTFTAEKSNGSQDIVIEIQKPDKGDTLIVGEKLSERDENGNEQTIIDHGEYTDRQNTEGNKEKYIIQTGVPKIFVFVSGGIAIAVALAAIFVGRRNEMS